MKKLLLMSLLVFLLGGTSYAQEFKPFKMGLGLGVAAPRNGAGFLLYAEPAYRIKDEIAVGIRFEGAIIARGFDDPYMNDEVEGSVIGSSTLFGQYYLSNRGFRPFVGFGTGLYYVVAVSTNDTMEGVNWGYKLGAYPRIGFDAGHFNFTIEYNMIPSSRLITANGNDHRVRNSYLSFKAGFSISGGRR